MKTGQNKMGIKIEEVTEKKVLEKTQAEERFVPEVITKDHNVNNSSWIFIK